MAGVLGPSACGEGLIHSGDGTGTIVDYSVASCGVALSGHHLRGKGAALGEYLEKCFQASPGSILSDDAVLSNWFAGEGVEVVALDLDNRHSKGDEDDHRVMGATFLRTERRARPANSSLRRARPRECR